MSRADLTVQRLRVCAVAVLLAWCAARAWSLGDPIIIEGLPPAKDPAVWQYDPAGDRWLLVVLHRAELRAWNMHETTVVREVPLVLPALPHRYVRWGQLLWHDAGTETLYLISGRGRAHDWPTYRLHVAQCDLSAEGVFDEAGDPLKLEFRDEREWPVIPGGEFLGATDYGIIDPEVARFGGRNVLYFTVVLHGVPGGRPHEKFLRARLLADSFEIDPSTPMISIYDGRADWADGVPHENVDNGVAEAPAHLPMGDADVLLFSSWPSDHNQRIAMLRSTTGPTGPWGEREVLLAADPTVEARHHTATSQETNGVGGQTTVVIGGRRWLIYQGLGTTPEDPTPRFRQMLRDGGDDLNPPPSSTRESF